ncbi:MAG: T9SS type A sorting domain-containing protein [Saprospiraceae bacterium]
MTLALKRNQIYLKCGLVQIEYIEEVSSVACTIFDITGKVVFRQANLSSGETVDISALVSGSYFIQLQNEEVIHSALIQKL